MTISLVGTGYSGTGDNSSGTGPMTTAAVNVSTGDLIICFVRWESSDTTVSLSDTAGNTYQQLANVKGAGANCAIATFYCLNATGNAANVCSATWAVAQSFRRVEQLVFRSSVGGSALSYTGTQTATASAATSISNSTAFDATHPSLVVVGQAAFSTRTLTSIVGSSGGSYTTSISANGVYHSGYLITSSSLSSETVTSTIGGGTSNLALSIIYFAEGAGTTLAWLRA